MDDKLRRQVRDAYGISELDAAVSAQIKWYETEAARKEDLAARAERGMAKLNAQVDEQMASYKTESATAAQEDEDYQWLRVGPRVIYDYVELVPPQAVEYRMGEQNSDDKSKN